jgi:hypothetical protein
MTAQEAHAVPPPRRELQCNILPPSEDDDVHFHALVCLVESRAPAMYTGAYKGVLCCNGPDFPMSAAPLLTSAPPWIRLHVTESRK